MKQPLTIQFHGMEASAAVETKAREFAARLDGLAPDLMACRVHIDLEQKHKTQGRPYGVRIDLTLPGHELVVNKVQDEDVYVALRDAFDSMKRQLDEVVRKRRGEEKQHALELRGQVVRLDTDSGTGYIRTADGDEYYFSRDNLAGVPFENVLTGSTVEFLPDAGKQGRQAKRVSVRD